MIAVLSFGFIGYRATPSLSIYILVTLNSFYFPHKSCYTTLYTFVLPLSLFGLKHLYHSRSLPSDFTLDVTTYRGLLEISRYCCALLLWAPFVLALSICISIFMYLSPPLDSKQFLESRNRVIFIFCLQFLA